ncbi:calcineurin inhibitor, partial [Cichlidogyrus casuarinus]
ELLAEVDQDKDGYVSEEEYLKDMGFANADPSQEEHRQTEINLFRQKRDKDHDGKLNFDEFMEWLVPHPEQFVKEEAEHLISQSDDDKDGKVSKEEMQKYHRVFSGSQITDYGDVLRRHDEL